MKRIGSNLQGTQCPARGPTSPGFSKVAKFILWSGCESVIYFNCFPNLALNLKEPYRDDAFEGHLIRPLKMAKPMNERLSKCAAYR